MAEPVILWFRRDLRLTDNPALAAAVESGRPVIPLFVLDETPGLRAPGEAGLWWLDKSLRALGKDLQALGSRLVLRRGPAGEVLSSMVEETGATAVFWNRLYDPGLTERDKTLKARLRAAGLEARSFNASLLIEPWELANGSGKPYQVYTAFWRAARPRLELGAEVRRPSRLPRPAQFPATESLDGWDLHPRAPDWSEGFSDWRPGEAGAAAELDRFIEAVLARYSTGRDQPDRNGTSRLSPHLHWGGIGPRQVWRAVEAAAHHGEVPESEAEKFLAELGWREFNHHLLFARPDLAEASWRLAYDQMKWRSAPKELEAWKRGRTGFPIVDAGMRQLWATGWMHNRVRMIVGSFLVKDLLIDWREGERWFWDTLVDADHANNAANWQWVAGSGADASPFFRIFNPITQGARFDPQGAYVRRWVPELAHLPADAIHLARTAGVNGYPRPIVDHGEARLRALAALKALPKERGVAPSPHAS